MIHDSIRDLKELADFPEYASVDAFIESKFEDLDFDVHVWEVTALSYATRTSTLRLRERLAAEGFTMVPQKRADSGRGYTSWDNNRWAGNECKGGSGWEQVSGFSGQNG